MRFLAYIIVGLMVIPVFMFHCVIVAVSVISDGIYKRR
jgi:hypothetical protein